MTFDEARALFPVLERIAYLNAGTFGPLPRPVAEAMTAGIAHDLAEGRTGLPYFEETIAARNELRGAFAALVHAEREHVALTSSTSEGCAIVLRGMLAAIALRPDWAHERAAEAASRCRMLLEGRVELLTPPVPATLVAFRPEEEPAVVVERLHVAGVHVRELPGRGIVRASCGWWTSDHDLDRLVAALEDDRG